MYSKLEIQEIPTNSDLTLRLADNSYYISGAGSNAILEITTPGSNCAVIFEVTKEFNTAFNSFTLKLVPNDTYAETTPLPDGVYKIKYSIAPNDRVYVNYKLFRNTTLLAKLAQEVCSLFAERSLLSTREFEQKSKQLFWIKNLIDTAKWTVDYQGDNNMGIELYNEAKDLLRKYTGAKEC